MEYQRISDYMAANLLVINDEKTKPIVFGNKTMNCKREDVSFQAGNHVIRPRANHKLLGAVVSQSLKWSDHIMNHEHSMIKQLRTRLNGIALISKDAGFKTKLMVSQAIFTSKLCYLIQVWGGTSEYLVRCLQVMQNKCAKAVTGMSWFTPTRVLLKKCNWMSVNQLVVYHTILTVHKAILNENPLYIYNKIYSENEQHKTSC